MGRLGICRVEERGDAVVVRGARCQWHRIAEGLTSVGYRSLYCSLSYALFLHFSSLLNG